VNIHDYLRVLRRRWPIVVGFVLAGVLLAGVYVMRSTPMYASSSRLFVSTSTFSSDLTQANQGSALAIARVQSYADLVGTHALATDVANALPGDQNADALASQVSASVATGTVNLTITAMDPDPASAQHIAQAYAEALTREVSQIESPGNGKPAPLHVSVVDDAQRPTAPVSPRIKLDLLFGLLLGLLVGAGAALGREMMDTSVTSVAELEEITQVPLLGTIPTDSGAVHKHLPESLKEHSPWAEAFRVLRTNMQFVDVDTDGRVFVVSSALPGEGKTTVIVNLAITMALGGQKVVLVESDLRRPRVGERLGLDDAVGTTTVLVGQLDVEDAIQEQPDTGLHVLTTGRRPPNPSELISSRSMQDLLERLRKRFDVVLVDAPPLLPVTDAALLASHADGLMLVARHGKTTREQLRQALHRVDSVDGHCIGVVMNMTPARGRGYSYGYSYEPLVDGRRRRTSS
jgi:capsular exopolysaccharide synthesis family protein